MKKKLLSLFFILFPTLTFGKGFFLGIGVHPQSFPGGSASLLSQINQLHANSIRTDYPWSQVEKVKSKYTTPNKEIENTIDNAIKQGIKPVLILGYGNSLYSKASSSNKRLKPIGEEAVNGYVKYAAWTANHYRNKSVIFEVWNEWVQGGGDGKKITLSAASVKSYSNLINRSCKAIKENNPLAQVIIGSTSPFDARSNKWLGDLLRLVNMSCVDGVSIHAYHYYPHNKSINAESVVTELEQLQKKLKDTTGLSKIDFYITEIGVPSIKRAKYDNYDIESYLNELIPVVKSQKYIKGLWWYDLINDGDDRNNIEHNFGLLYTDKTRKPVANAFEKAAKENNG